MGIFRRARKAPISGSDPGQLPLPDTNVLTKRPAELRDATHRAVASAATNTVWPPNVASYVDAMTVMLEAIAVELNWPKGECDAALRAAANLGVAFTRLGRDGDPPVAPAVVICALELAAYRNTRLGPDEMWVIANQVTRNSYDLAMNPGLAAEERLPTLDSVGKALAAAPRYKVMADAMEAVWDANVGSGGK